MLTKFILFLSIQLLGANPIFLAPPTNPILWTIESPRIKQAFNAYRNFDFQNCISILNKKIITTKPSNQNEWLEIELRVMSWVQLGELKKSRHQLSVLKNILDSHSDLSRLKLLTVITELWAGEEDERLSGKRLRNLSLEWKKINNYNLEIMAEICNLAYLWREERIEDMPSSLRSLEKNLGKLYNYKHPAWRIYYVYKILMHTIKYDAQNRYISPLFDQIDKSDFTSSIQNALFKQPTKGFCFMYQGQTNRGLRHLEAALGLFEKHLGHASPLTLQFGIEVGNILWENNQFSTAYNLAKRLHQICKKVHGPKSRMTIKYRVLLAKCMMRLRRNSEASDLLTSSFAALDLDKQIRLSAEIHLQLCRLFLEKDQFRKANNHLNLGRTIASRHFKPNHSFIKEFQRLSVILKNRQNSIPYKTLAPTKTIRIE